MKYSLGTEVRYWFLSGRIFIIFVSILFVFLFGEYLNFEGLKEANVCFNHSEEFLKDHVEEMIQEPYSVETFENGRSSILNPISYHKHEVINRLYYCSPYYALRQCSEMALLAFPILMTVIGALCIESDYRKNIVKLRVASEGKTNYLLCKQAVMIAFCALTTIIATIVAFLTSFIVYDRAKKLITSKWIDIPEDFSTDGVKTFLGMLFMLFVMLFFLEAGFCLTCVFKNALVPILIIDGLWYFTKSFSKYEPRNLLTNLALKNLDFGGAIHVQLHGEVSNLISVSVMLICLLLIFGFGSFVYGKRSAFN